MSATPRTVGELFERRFRKLRPEVEAMPWGTLDPRDHAEALVIAARRSWTGATFQERRTDVTDQKSVRHHLDSDRCRGDRRC